MFQREGSKIVCSHFAISRSLPPPCKVRRKKKPVFQYLEEHPSAGYEWEHDMDLRPVSDKVVIQSILWKDDRDLHYDSRPVFAEKSTDELRWEDYLLRSSREKQPKVTRCFFFLLWTHASPRQRLRARWTPFSFFRSPFFRSSLAHHFFGTLQLGFCVVFSPE